MRKSAKRKEKPPGFSMFCKIHQTTRYCFYQSLPRLCDVLIFHRASLTWNDGCSITIGSIWLQSAANIPCKRISTIFDRKYVLRTGKNEVHSFNLRFLGGLGSRRFFSIIMVGWKTLTLNGNRVRFDPESIHQNYLPVAGIISFFVQVDFVLHFSNSSLDYIHRGGKIFWEGLYQRKTSQIIIPSDLSQFWIKYT